MPTPSTGKLADPAWRKHRAARAGRSRTTPDYHIAKLVELADELTAEQITVLRTLLQVVAQ